MKLLTTGELTQHLRKSHRCQTLEQWQVTRTLRKANVPVKRLGRWRVFEMADVPLVEAALVEAGYLARK